MTTTDKPITTMVLARLDRACPRVGESLRLNHVFRRHELAQALAVLEHVPDRYTLHGPRPFIVVRVS